MNLDNIPTPCYLIDRAKLEENCRLLKSIQEQSGCKILLALKSYATFATFPYIKPYLAGTAASGLYEARLGHEEFDGEVHVYSPAFKTEEIYDLIGFAHTIIFNTPSQWSKYRTTLENASRHIECGLRINPEYSEVDVDVYNPCSSNSRLGSTLHQIQDADLEGIDGIHFHSLCQKDANALERTLAVIEEKFGWLLEKVRWINCGGGHHITKPGYQVEKLCQLLRHLSNTYDLEVYLEPGEAIVYEAGYLVSTVLDIHENEKSLAILDTSATAHMPDVLEMPYRPRIKGAEDFDVYSYNYGLGGLTCLAGDVIGDYSFANPLQIGDKLVLEDMAQYTMVRNTMFNGVPLPTIALYHPEKDQIDIIKTFDYSFYRNRLS